MDRTFKPRGHYFQLIAVWFTSEDFRSIPIAAEVKEAISREINPIELKFMRSRDNFCGLGSSRGSR
ncbi:MAG: hypothetical protein DWQ01_10120 [Planctomycetota bacterium]|nr:MAG: hypothetical protein DWQ01_10120 [Planctomycetota bacterium]